MDTTLEPVEEMEDPLLRDEIECLEGRALMAMLRTVLLALFGAALACWGLSWLFRPYLEAQGAGFFLLGVGLWFWWGARYELPEGLRLRAEAERLREQHES